MRLGDGPGRYVHFRIGLNVRERPAGKTRVEVTTPLSFGGQDSEWTNNALDAPPYAYAHLGTARRIDAESHHPRMLPTANVLTRTLERVALGVQEDLYFRMVVADAPPGTVDAYPVRIRVDAEDADKPTEVTYDLLQAGLVA